MSLAKVTALYLLVIVPGCEGPVQSIIHAAGVGALEVVAVGHHALPRSPFLIIVYVKDCVVQASCLPHNWYGAIPAQRSRY